MLFAGLSLLAAADPTTVLLALIAAVFGGGGATLITAFVAWRRFRKEQSEAVEQLNINRFEVQLDGYDTMLGRLGEENARLLAQVVTMRERAAEDHERIFTLERELASAQARIEVLERESDG